MALEGRTLEQIVAEECARDPEFKREWPKARRWVRKYNRRWLAIEERGLRSGRPHRRHKSHR